MTAATGTLRCLLVEDDDDHAELVRRGLSQAPDRTVIDRVADGEEALRYLRGEPPFLGRPAPDLILLDLRLPGIDGHGVLEAVKADPGLWSVPVVVLSTSDDEADLERAYRGFANSYLVKPPEFDRFKRMVQDLGTYWGEWNRVAASRGSG